MWREYIIVDDENVTFYVGGLSVIEVLKL
jgi:hypothetical protein